jgi:hypothetical protein
MPAPHQDEKGSVVSERGVRRLSSNVEAKVNRLSNSLNQHIARLSLRMTSVQLRNRCNIEPFFVALDYNLEAVCHIIKTPKA